jgi:hypothetical protein
MDLWLAFALGQASKEAVRCFVTSQVYWQRLYKAKRNPYAKAIQLQGIANC